MGLETVVRVSLPHPWGEVDCPSVVVNGQERFAYPGGRLYSRAELYRLGRQHGAEVTVIKLPTHKGRATRAGWAGKGKVNAQS